MTEPSPAAELTRIVQTGTPAACLDFLASLAPKDREALGKTATALFKDWQQAYLNSFSAEKAPTAVRPEVARAAVLASASLAQVKSCGWLLCPETDLLLEVLTRFRPDWLEAWVQFMLEDSPHNFQRVAPIWERGLCAKPQGELFVMGLIVDPRSTSVRRGGVDPAAGAHADDPYADFWGLFEYEGQGEFSLAARDKYVARADSWSAALCHLSDTGKMDRDRLLDASLNALSRDFAQFRASWFARFFEAMAPTLPEQIARTDRFLHLLGSVIPPTVSFALKALGRIDKAQPLDEASLLAALPPALQARQKGTVTTALRLIETATKRAPDRRPQALEITREALIHEAADVQARALDLLRKLGIEDAPDQIEALRDYADGLAPTLRPRLTALTGAQPIAPPDTPLPPTTGPQAIAPITDFDGFLAEFLHVLEDTSDPLRIERTIDGLSRHGADLPQDTDTVLGPLAKRAVQILKTNGDMTLRRALAHLAQSYAQRTPPQTPERMVFGSEVSLGWSHRKPHLGPQNFVTAFLRRTFDILLQVQRGHRLPLLAAPTDDRAMIAPQVLAERLAAFESAGVEPSPTDLSIAFLRLAPQGREKALNALEPRSEASRALRYALGGPLEDPGPTAHAWVAADAARIPRADAPRIARLARVTAPDVGTPARYTPSLKTKHYDQYVHPEISVETAPPITQELPDTCLPGLFHLTTAGLFGGSVCGHTADDIRWAGTVWPQNLEPFFAQGVHVFDPDQKLSNSPYAAFVAPLLQGHVTPGPMGHLLLSLTLASTDAAVRSLALEAVISGIAEARLDNDLLADATRDLITRTPLPVARWTRAFAEAARISTQHSSYLRALTTKLMRFDPAAPPRDIGGLVELLFELHVEADAPLTDTDARACLSAVKAGGKLGRFAKRLLAA